MKTGASSGAVPKAKLYEDRVEEIFHTAHPGSPPVVTKFRPTSPKNVQVPKVPAKVVTDLDESTDELETYDTGRITKELEARLDAEERKLANRKTPTLDERSSSSMSHRKSVSFDLTDPEEDEATKRRRMQDKPIKGILRSSSPQNALETVATWIRSSQEHLGSSCEEPEDHENPFREEVLAAQKRPKSMFYEPVEVPAPMKTFASASNLATDRPKPPLPPKPKPKKANLVRNTGFEVLKRSDLGYVEFEHDPLTNTIKEVGREFNPDDPLPPLPTIPPPRPTVSRIPHLQSQRSVERPKQSPPPPPPKTPIIVDSEVVEILPPIKKETFPKLERAKEHLENSKENVLVTDAIHRQILLQENQLRNALLEDPNANLVEIDSDPNNNQQQESRIPILQQTRVLPVHYTQLPTPQQPGYRIQDFVPPPSTVSYPFKPTTLHHYSPLPHDQSSNKKNNNRFTDFYANNVIISNSSSTASEMSPVMVGYVETQYLPPAGHVTVEQIESAGTSRSSSTATITTEYTPINLTLPSATRTSFIQEESSPPLTTFGKQTAV